MKKVNIFLFIVFIFVVIGMIVLFANKGWQTKTVNYPFFLSTKFSTSNVRSGPGEDFPIIWIYKEKYMPIKIIASYKNWYQIEDYSGKIGWVFKNITSPIKTAITKEKIQVYKNASLSSKRVATIDKGIVVKINNDKEDYVKITLIINKLKITGWTLKTNLWGII